MPDPVATGLLVETLRKERPEPLHELAHTAGINERTWRRVERGGGYSRRTIHGVAHALGRAVADLEGAAEPVALSQLDRIEVQIGEVRDAVERLAEASPSAEQWAALLAGAGLIDQPDEAPGREHG